MKRTLNTIINRLKSEKNDEHYTQLSDIEVAVRGAETNVVEYVWGKDLSGSFQGAGGVGGLLYEKRNGAIYIPYQDAFGNITGYWDTNGVIVAEYTYDAFGRTIAQSGPMADVFRHRFSTKYFDTETGFYYYGYRYYFPELRRWLSRDPIEEEDSANLYSFVHNSALNSLDVYGLQQMTLNYDFATDISKFEKLVNWSTRSGMTVEEVKQDIIKRVTPYGQSGRGACKCISHVRFAGHGSDGDIYLGDGMRNILSGSFIKMWSKGAKGPYVPHEIMNLLSTVKNLACEKMTVEFATCFSGRGEYGKDLKDQLQSFFGKNVSVILYDRAIRFYFNSVH